MPDLDFLTNETMAQQVARDQRDQDAYVFSDGWTPTHTTIAWLFVFVVMIYAVIDGNWPWQRPRA